MRSGLAIFVTLLVCLLLLVLYWFLGKMQMSNSIRQIDQEIAEVEQQLDNLRIQKEEIAKLKAQLPIWLKQSQLFRKSIPADVEDHIFFANLSAELDNHPSVTLLSVESVFGGPWLGEVKEDQQTELSEMGIDPEVAANIRVVFYSVTLSGTFGDTLSVFENLKRSQRLYTIDLISGPAIGGSGTISVNNQQESTPLQFSGRLYFNLADPALNIDEIERMYFDALTLRVHRAVTEGGHKLLSEDAPDQELNESGEGESAPDGSTDFQNDTDDNPCAEMDTADAGSAARSGNLLTGHGFVAMVAAGKSGSAPQKGKQR